LRNPLKKHQIFLAETGKRIAFVKQVRTEDLFMKAYRISLAAALVFTCALLVSCQNSGNGTADAASGSRTSIFGKSAPPPTVPSGTDVEVRLADSIGSGISHSGDTFSATVARPIKVNGQVVIPEGADVTGRVVSARASGHLETPAELGIELTSVSIGGQTYNLETSERAWHGRSHKGHDAKWIGGLAGGGALLGALVGHGKGAAIGAGVGAGAGTATAYATGKKNIYLPSETELRFILRKPLTISNAG
jgi:hypothetical protein